MNLVNDFDDWVNEWLHDGDRVCVHSIPQSLRLLVACVPSGSYLVGNGTLFGSHFSNLKLRGATTNVLTRLGIEYYTNLCTLKPNYEVFPVCKIETLNDMAQRSKLTRLLDINLFILERVTTNVVRCAVKRGNKKRGICNTVVTYSHRVRLFDIRNAPAALGKAFAFTLLVTSPTCSLSTFPNWLFSSSVVILNSSKNLN